MIRYHGLTYKTKMIGSIECRTIYAGRTKLIQACASMMENDRANGTACWHVSRWQKDGELSRAIPGHRWQDALEMALVYGDALGVIRHR